MHWRRHKAKEEGKAKRSLFERLKGKSKDGKKREDNDVDAKLERKDGPRVSGWISSKTTDKPRNGKVISESQEVNERGWQGREDVQKSDQRIGFLGENDKKDDEKMAGGNERGVRQVGSPMFFSDIPTPVDDNIRTNARNSTTSQVEFLRYYAPVAEVLNEAPAVLKTTAYDGYTKATADDSKPEIFPSAEGVVCLPWHSPASESKSQPQSEEMSQPKESSQPEKLSPASCKCRETPVCEERYFRDTARCHYCRQCEKCVEMLRRNWCINCQDNRPILNLPIELLEIICSYLGTSDKLLFQLSCKAFYHSIPRPQTPISTSEIPSFFRLIRDLIPPHLDYCEECTRYHRPTSKKRIIWLRGSSGTQKFCLLAFDRTHPRSTLHGMLKSDYFVCRFCFYVRGVKGCKTCHKCVNCSGVWYSKSVVECIECDQGKVHCTICRRLRSDCRDRCAIGFTRCRMCRESLPRHSTCWKCENCGLCAVLLQDKSRNSMCCTTCMESRRRAPLVEGDVRGTGVRFGKDDVVSSDFAAIFAPYSFQFNLSH